ncbi:MAG: GlcNAc-PI de-N-acetylase [Acidimicrobiia bacterium]
MTRNVLVVAPHPDDESLGVGGTIAKYADQGDHVFVLMVSGHLPPLYPAGSFETTEREAREAFRLLGVSNSAFLKIPATLVGTEPVAQLNRRISSVIEELEPEVVFCPFPDRHVDHRVIFEATMVATRPVGAGRGIRMLAAYETLSETHWNAPHIEPVFVPTWVNDITATVDKKLAALRCYASQIPACPGARSIEAVEALARFRGTQAGFAYGEAFSVIRMVS